METARPGQDRPVIRAATAADAPALVPLIESAYRGDASRAGWTTEADLLDGQRTDEEGVTAVLTAEGSRVLLAEHPEGPEHPEGAENPAGPIACCHIEHRGDHAYFGMFAVLPALQGAGLGRVMLAEAERVARAEWGVREMHMTVIRQREELIAWYERRGYRRTGKMVPFPYGDERFGIPRRADLEFELLVKELP
ncbi:MULTISPECIES: GNAT family N-acetyltransferase [Streptomyces]|uniref:GNAT family N-acetyltransferase n=1 Tax=Streptomyces TaxID=1883 RepID=UPI00163B7B2B|nr:MULTISPECIES: GNAT family N-acetyltransferase [Streptomyces]MBC2874185.1 GNAT family N-acetyltransferase [Streptomyces sp. TYQ1024]UBI41332.1 GNAT family N-acetyltransferase [Streptomyces mobaraensis]UKW33831.1 GNAT family N-acetyltransferase [Streptomyces sp. TYQ1024]